MLYLWNLTLTPDRTRMLAAALTHPCNQLTKLAVATSDSQCVDIILDVLTHRNFKLLHLNVVDCTNYDHPRILRVMGSMNCKLAELAIGQGTYVMSQKIRDRRGRILLLLHARRIPADLVRVISLLL